MKRKICLMVLTLCAALLLSGCAMRTVEEMYALPRRSEEYNHLQSAIDAAMTGLSYSAPISGENQQTVQSADLDGDGVDECLVFAAGSGERPLEVLIFTQDDNERYRLSEVIECNGTVFEQVEYVNFDGKPGCELVLSRQVSENVLRRLSVYSFAGGSAEQLLVVGCSKFVTSDLDTNGLSEVLVLRPSEAEEPGGMAVLYSYNAKEDQVQRSVETRLSESPANIRRVVSGHLQDDIPAVYVTSSMGDSAVVTDVFAFQNGDFTNVAYAGGVDTSIQTVHNFYVYSEDIDGDGVLEIPSLITMKAMTEWKEGEQKFLLQWFSLDSKGRKIDKFYTFHNYMNGWYLRMDENWAGRTSVAQSEGVYSFYVWDETYTEASSLFDIYTFTGSNRDLEAQSDGRFPLYRAEGVAYGASIAPGAEEFGITPDILKNNFRLIRQDWRAGES